MHKAAISNHSRAGWSIWVGVPCGHYTFSWTLPISMRSMKGFCTTEKLDFRSVGSLIVASDNARGFGGLKRIREERASFPRIISQQWSG